MEVIKRVLDEARFERLRSAVCAGLLDEQSRHGQPMNWPLAFANRPLPDTRTLRYKGHWPVENYPYLQRESAVVCLEPALRR